MGPAVPRPEVAVFSCPTAGADRQDRNTTAQISVWLDDFTCAPPRRNQEWTQNKDHNHFRRLSLSGPVRPLLTYVLRFFVQRVESLNHIGNQFDHASPIHS